MIAAILLDLNHVDITLATTQMILAILVVNTLSNVVETPVHAVQEKVHVKSIHTCATQLLLHSSCPDVSSVLRFLTIPFRPVLPGITKMTSQHKLIELVGLSLTENRIFQGLWTIDILEYQSQRVFGILLGQATVPTVETQTASRTQIMVLRSPEKFRTGSTGPSVPSVVTNGRSCENIDTATLLVVLMTEQIVLVGHNAQDGQVLQPRLDSAS